MNVVVLGLWHLGCVTAACCAEHFSVVGIDFDETTVIGLRAGNAPISEPGLDELIKRGLVSGQLTFAVGADSAALGAADVLWVCYDTPVDENDVADVPFVLDKLAACLPALRPGATVLISSQIPAGTCRELETRHPGISFACSPENLRLGKALDIFRHPERIVAGVRDNAARAALEPIFAPFCSEMLWMRPESAEMTKHGINAWLALSVTFANEIARLCEAVGADAREVERGLRSEPRIGQKAYIRPGAAFAGGTLARDVVALIQLARAHHGDPPAFSPRSSPGTRHTRTGRLGRLQHAARPAGGRDGGGARPDVQTGHGHPAAQRRGGTREKTARGRRARALLRSRGVRPAAGTRGRAACAPTLDDAVADADAAVVATEWPQIKERRTGPRWSPGCAGASWWTPTAFSNSAWSKFPASSISPSARPPRSFYLMKLAHRNAIVTGGSQGLGRAIVETFVREGANVLLCARDEKAAVELAESLQAHVPLPGQRVVAEGCDVSSPEEVETAFRHRRRGVRHAARPGEQRRAFTAPRDRPTRSISRNGGAPWTSTCTARCCPAARPCGGSRSTGYGKIVNLSGGGATNPMPNLSAYAASKAAVVRLTETLALELQPFGVDVNAVAPGALNTRLLDEVHCQPDPDKVGAEFYQNALKQATDGGVPLTLGADLCVYLASAKSDGMTGKLLSAKWDPWKRLHDYKAELGSAATSTPCAASRPEDRGRRSWPLD